MVYKISKTYSSTRPSQQIAKVTIFLFYGEYLRQLFTQRISLFPVFSSFPRLEHLNLSHNALHTVAQSAFLLPSLVSLDMSHNSLFEAAYFMFDTSPKLRNIYFSNNSISILQGEVTICHSSLLQHVFDTDKVSLTLVNIFQRKPFHCYRGWKVWTFLTILL